MLKSAKIWDQMEKLYGVDGKGMEPVEVITSGSIALDDILGVWGLPKGRIIQYAGKESSGKTLMSLMAIKEWQMLDPDNWAVFIDAEYTYNKAWAEKLGVDNDRVFLIKENDGVKIFTALCGVPHKELGKEKAKPGILDMEAEEPSGLGIIVLDSVAAMQAPVESTKTVGNTNMAPMGRFLPDALKRLTPLLSKTGVAFIAINQVRVDLGKMFGDPTSTPGGKAWKHYCSVMLHFTSSESKESWFLDDNGTKYGHIVGARVDKNKVACPNSKCNFDVKYESGISNRHKEVFDIGVKYGVIQRPNNVSYLYEDYKWKGKEACIKAILENNLQDEILVKSKESKASGVKPVEIESVVELNDTDVE